MFFSENGQATLGIDKMKTKKHEKTSDIKQIIMRNLKFMKKTLKRIESEIEKLNRKKQKVFTRTNHSVLRGFY